MSLKQLEKHRDLLTDVIYKRALHIVTENARVLDSGQALRSGDIERFGKRMADSGVFAGIWISVDSGHEICVYHCSTGTA